jgi:hypothetical protein
LSEFIQLGLGVWRTDERPLKRNLFENCKLMSDFNVIHIINNPVISAFQIR